MKYFGVQSPALTAVEMKLKRVLRFFVAVVGAIVGFMSLFNPMCKKQPEYQ